MKKDDVNTNGFASLSTLADDGQPSPVATPVPGPLQPGLPQAIQAMSGLGALQDTQPISDDPPPADQSAPAGEDLLRTAPRTADDLPFRLNTLSDATFFFQPPGNDGRFFLLAPLAQPFRPDLVVRNKKRTVTLGDSVFNANGAGQTLEDDFVLKPTRSKTRTYFVEIQNDGTLPDIIQVQGMLAGANYSVRYLLGPAGGDGTVTKGARVDVTAAVANGMLQIPLQPGASRELMVLLRAEKNAGIQARVVVTGTSRNNARLSDRVRINTTIVMAQPDVSIFENGVEIGKNIINTSGTNQKLAFDLAPLSSRIVTLNVFNAGNVRDTFTVQIKKTDDSTNSVRLSAAFNAGASVEGAFNPKKGLNKLRLTLDPNASATLTLMVRMKRKPKNGAIIEVRATSRKDKSKKDVVRIVTSRSK